MFPVRAAAVVAGIKAPQAARTLALLLFYLAINPILLSIEAQK